jgi:hypothetical protein
MSSPFPKRLNLLDPGVRFTAWLCSSSMASCARFYPDSLMEPGRTSCSMKFLAMQRRERDRDSDDRLVTHRRLLRLELEPSASGLGPSRSWWAPAEAVRSLRNTGCRRDQRRRVRHAGLTRSGISPRSQVAKHSRRYRLCRGGIGSRKDLVVLVIFFSAGRPREYFRTYRHYDDADHVPRGGRYFFASAWRTCSVKFFSDLANMSVNALASMQVSQRESTGSPASKGRPRFW